MSQLSQTTSQLSVVASPRRKKGRATNAPPEPSQATTTTNIVFLCPLSLTPQTIRGALENSSPAFPPITKVALRPYQRGSESQLAQVSFSSQERAAAAQSSLSQAPPLFISSAIELAAPPSTPTTNILHQLVHPSSFTFDPTACMVPSCPYHDPNSFRSLDAARDHTIHFHGDILHALGSQSLLGHYGWAQCPHCLTHLIGDDQWQTHQLTCATLRLRTTREALSIPRATPSPTNPLTSKRLLNRSTRRLTAPPLTANNTRPTNRKTPPPLWPPHKNHPLEPHQCDEPSPTSRIQGIHRATQS